MCAAAGHSKLLEEVALEPLLAGATETTAGQWQGALVLRALAALATPGSHLRSRILSSIRQMLPTMLAGSVSNSHHQEMLVGVLRVLRHHMAPFSPAEGEVATAVGMDLLTGVIQLTMVSQMCSVSIMHGRRCRPGRLEHACLHSLLRFFTCFILRIHVRGCLHM